MNKCLQKFIENGHFYKEIMQKQTVQTIPFFLRSISTNIKKLFECMLQIGD